MADKNEEIYNFALQNGLKRSRALIKRELGIGQLSDKEVYQLMALRPREGDE